MAIDETVLHWLMAAPVLGLGVGLTLMWIVSCPWNSGRSGKGDDRPE